MTVRLCYLQREHTRCVVCNVQSAPGSDRLPWLSAGGAYKVRCVHFLKSDRLSLLSAGGTYKVRCVQNARSGCLYSLSIKGAYKVRCVQFLKSD